MNEINSSKRLKFAVAEKAEGDKILKVKSAEAEAEAKYLSGVGVAKQRKAIVGGLKSSIVDFSDGVKGSSSKDVMQLQHYICSMLEVIRRYLKTVYYTSRICEVANLGLLLFYIDLVSTKFNVGT